MLWVKILLSVVLLGTAALMGWLARVSRSRRLPLNDIAGYRTRTVMSSEAAWEEAHFVAAPWTARVGVVFGITGVVMLLPLSDMWVWTVLGLGVVVGMVVLWIGAWVAQQTAKQVWSQCDSA